MKMNKSNENQIDVKEINNNDLIDPKRIFFTSDAGKLVTGYQNNGESLFLNKKGELTSVVETENNLPSKNMKSIKQILSGTTNNDDPIAIIEKAIRPFLFFVDDECYTLISTFAALSYVVNLFDSIPYLRLTGSTGSGKSTVMKVMEVLSYNPESTVSVTSASLFRMIDSNHPTIFIDESEDLDKRGRSNNSLFQVLNSGYKKDGRTHRIVKGNLVPFSTYGLKVIASINPLSDALENRCIRIEMKKSIKADRLKYPGDQEKQSLRELRKIIVGGLNKRLPDMMKIINNPDLLKLDSAIQNREFEKWFPILCIAKVFSTGKKNHFDKLHKFAINVIKSSIEEDTSPETVCKELIVEYAKGNSNKSLLPDDKKYLVYRAERIFHMIKNADLYNSYKDRSELTKVLKRINVIADRRRFGGDPIAIYKIPRTILNKEKGK